MLVVFHVFQAIGFYGFGNWVPKLISCQGVEIVNSLKYALTLAIGGFGPRTRGLALESIANS